MHCRIQIIVYYTMKLFQNYYFIILPFLTKTLHQHMQDTNIENLTLYLVCLQHTNLYFYLPYISLNMVGKDNTDTHLLQQQFKNINYHLYIVPLEQKGTK